MTLAAGTKLGPYEILSPLGAGGMGEVYRARDTRLGREVAVKVLPESFAADPDRLRRFEQEARAIAALNHPNILAVHDVGESGAVHYLVSELLEGEPLRSKITSAGLGTRRAIEYALQIAHGLAAAHDKGIVHRDLKPENIFVTRDGRVKILDFGLARQEARTARAGADATLTSPVQTAAGMVMGTASYMAPEQVRGHAADHRSDIFAFGAVLYEMLAGRRAFQHDTAAETMTAILKEDPPELTSFAVQVAPALDRIVRRCLEKEPEQRFQSAKDLAFALEAVSGTTHTSGTAPAFSSVRPPSWRTPAVLLGLAAAIALAAYFARTHRSQRSGDFERVTFQRGYIKGARFTPDGKRVVYSAMWEGRPYELFTATIGEHAARPLDLKNTLLVGISENGDLAVLTNLRRARTTGWMQVGTLARASLSGGGLRELLEDVWDADISRDGKQFAVVRTPAGEQQLEYPVGRPLFKTNGYISDLRISPDGKQVAFMEHPVFADDRGYVDIADEKGSVKRLSPETSGEQGLAWSPDGRELWYGGVPSDSITQERVLCAVTLDGHFREIFAVPGELRVSDVASDGRVLLSHETLSSAQIVASREITFSHGVPSVSEERNVSALGYASWGALSADGKAVAFTESGPGVPNDYLVFFRRLDGSPAVELGEGASLGLSPDGKYAIAVLPSQPSKIRIYPTGAGETRSLDVAPVVVDRYFVSWLPGQKEFSFLGHEGDGPPHAYRVSFEGGPAHPLTTQLGAHFWNRISPDGRFVAEGFGVGTTRQGNDAIVEIATGKSSPAPWQHREEPIDWDQDGKHIFVADEADEGTTIFRIDLSTGQRQVWKKIQPADPAGVLAVSRFFVTPSGASVGYSETQILSALYVYSEK